MDKKSNKIKLSLLKKFLKLKKQGWSNNYAASIAGIPRSKLKDLFDEQPRFLLRCAELSNGVAARMTRFHYHLKLRKQKNEIL